MASDASLIDQIEQDALNDSVPLATALRKCITLGGRSGSERLRDWATRELKGYYDDEVELPEYRIVPAPLQIDGFSGNFHITGQQIPHSMLPDFAQEHIQEQVELRDGVGQIAAMLKQDEIKLMPKMAADLARVMNSQADNPYQQIVSLYWHVSHVSVEGVLDQIRTSLTQLVAELRATMAEGETVPSAEAADAAVNVVVTGERHHVVVTTAQASGSATANASPADDGFWTRSRKIGAVVVGAATVVAAVVAVLEFV